MMHSIAVLRRALRKCALGLGAVVIASLALAGVASAAVITVNPDNSSGTDNLTAAINTANTNADASNTIVLNPGRYTPKGKLNITKNLTITANHALQASAGAASTSVDGSLQSSAQDVFVVNAGVTVTLDGFQIVSGGGSGFASIHLLGTSGSTPGGKLRTWGLAITGAGGNGVQVDSGANATLNETEINAAAANAIVNSGTLTVNSSDLVSQGQIGINNTGGTFAVSDTLLAFGTGAECNGGTASNGGPGSLDDDGTCGVQYSRNTNVDLYNYTPAANGGPTLSVQLPAANPDTTNKGVNCPTTDQRFFVNPLNGLGQRQCDIGAVTTGATRQTTPPACVVTRTQYPPAVATAQQDVTVTDTGSGMGPEYGTFTDPQLSGAINPDDAITNLAITNGSVAFTPFTMPSTNGLVLTATKGTTAASTTTSGQQTLPASTLTVASTSGFAIGGQLTVTSSAGTQTLSYTGKTATSFTGVTGGTGTVAAGATVQGSSISTWSFTATNWAGISKNCS